MAAAAAAGRGSRAAAALLPLLLLAAVQCSVLRVLTSANGYAFRPRPEHYLLITTTNWLSTLYHRRARTEQQRTKSKRNKKPGLTNCPQCANRTINTINSAGKYAHNAISNYR